MKPSNHEQSKRHTFDSFCKKILKHEARDYYDELKRQRRKEKTFSDLSAKEIEKLYIVDKYFATEQIFNVLDFDIFDTDEIQIYFKGSKILVLYRYTYSLFLWDNLRPQITPQFYIEQITLKPAICNKQVAGFLLTKYLYFQPKVLKTSYIFMHFFKKLDKLHLLQFFKYSLGVALRLLFLIFQI